MSDREELMALRRLAELEDKASGKMPVSADAIATRKAANPAEYNSASPEFQRRYGMTQGEVNVGALANSTLQIPRGMVKAALAIPTMAADFGVGLRNFVTGERREGATPMVNRWLEKSGYAAPDSAAAAATEFVAGVYGGSKIPAPTIKNPAPSGFSGPTNPRLQVLQEAQEKGYRVPPATTNPNAKTRTLEGLAGKLSTAQAASAKNQAVTDQLAARAIGLPDDQPITLEAIQEVRERAGTAYEAIRSAGRLTADEKYAADLARIGAKYKGAAKDFPELAKSEVTDAVEFMNKTDFDADSAVDVIRILRDKADAAYAAGNKTLGKAYRELSKAAEDVIDRNLVARGEGASGMLGAYRDARQLIAKTYTVERALNASTGSVSATKIGSQLSKGAPLSGELRNIGQFAQAFPKAAREFNESLPGVSPLDFYAAGGTAAATGNPAMLAYPFTRQGVRNFLLSERGNALAVPTATPERNALAYLGLAGGLQSIR